VTTAFPFTFKVFKTSEVVVTLADADGNLTELALGSDYTVCLNAGQDQNPGGTVNAVHAYASGYSITLISGVAQTQPMVLTNTGGFYPPVINDATDRNTILIQQLAERLDRAIIAPVNQTDPLALPSSSQRLGMVLGFDDATGGLKLYGSGQFKGDPGGNVMAVGTCAAMINISVPNGTDVVATTGYALKGDGGHAFYRRVTAKPVHPGRFQSLDGGWWEVLPDAGEINVAWFGADPTGAIPSDAAFIGAHQMRAAYRSTWSYGDPLSNLSIRVPGGKFLITNSESLCPSTYTTKTSGFVMRGISTPPPTSFSRRPADRK
jgi:hypothetical protein